MFDELMSKLTDEEKMKLVNMILSCMAPVIDIENRNSNDYVAKPLIYNADAGEIYVEFQAVEREGRE